MQRSLGLVGIVTVAFVVATVQAQQVGPWAPTCALDTRTNTEVCRADMTTQYRRNSVLVSVGTDDEKPTVALQVSDAEVRYAQLLVRDAPAPAELICEALQCAMSYDDARMVIEQFQTADSAQVRLFTGSGATVMVRLSLSGFNEAYAAARGN